MIEVINRVNNYWQETHPQHGRSFWDNAAYHTGNMEVFFLTGNPLYLEKLHECWTYANSIMYDAEEGLYYRDGKYVYPKHKSVNGKKDFWARGDGWVLAALAKVLKDLSETDQYRREYIDRFWTMAKSVAAGHAVCSTLSMLPVLKPAVLLSLPMVCYGG